MRAILPLVLGLFIVCSTAKKLSPFVPGEISRYNVDIARAEYVKEKAREKQSEPRMLVQENKDTPETTEAPPPRKHF